MNCIYPITLWLWICRFSSCAWLTTIYLSGPVSCSPRWSIWWHRCSAPPARWICHWSIFRVPPFSFRCFQAISWLSRRSSSWGTRAGSWSCSPQGHRGHSWARCTWFWRSTPHASWDPWAWRSRWRHPPRGYTCISGSIPIDADLHIDFRSSLLGEWLLRLILRDEVLLHDVEAMELLDSQEINKILHS